MAETTRVVVPRALAGERLDRALAASLPLSRRALREAIAAGAVSRNGTVVRQLGRRVEAGDVLELRAGTGAGAAEVSGGIRDPGSGSGSGQLVAREGLPTLPPIVFRDSYLLALDKPAGMLSQASARTPGELAADELVLAHLTLELGRRPFVRLVHRIDRDTSGVLLFALNPTATAPLARAWGSDAVERRYVARVDGRLERDSERIELPIAKVADSWRFEVAPEGQSAITEVEVVERREHDTLVMCRLRTGRTHQVRVHLAAIGHPVIGDRLYAGAPAPRLLLHAETLVLPHPATGDRIEINAPRPAELW